MNILAKLTASISVPWNAFVVAFLYYTLLAVVMIGGGSPGNTAVAGAYSLPPVMYAATLALRLVRAAWAWVKPVHGDALTPTAHSAA